MAIKLMYYEFMPNNGEKIEGRHTVLSLSLLAERRGMSDRELQKVVMVALDEVIIIKDVGKFRRTQ